MLKISIVDGERSVLRDWQERIVRSAVEAGLDLQADGGGVPPAAGREPRRCERHSVLSAMAALRESALLSRLEARGDAALLVLGWR